MEPDLIYSVLNLTMWMILKCFNIRVLPLDESIEECAGESAVEPTGELTEDVEIRGSPEALPLTSKKKMQPKSCMDELVYMMNMFKDGKINIRQLEIFFEQWKSRKDVVNDVTEKKVGRCCHLAVTKFTTSYNFETQT